MPVQVLPDETKFKEFCQEMKLMGFRKLGWSEARKDLDRFDKQAPRNREGREAGFIFFANNLKVIVWTTFLEEQKKSREEDTGWVLILEVGKDNPETLPHSKPARRTQNYLETLRIRSQIAKERVLSRPLCPICKSFMHITMGKGIGSRYWRCENLTIHTLKNRPRESFDLGLSPESKEFLKQQRKSSRKYFQKRKAIGKVPGSARFPENRKPWKKKGS